MTPGRISPSVEDVRKQILDAAENRFEYYGLRKTTMAEIASDVGMSAANLYRYFENKEDIAAACASRCMSEGIDRLKGLLKNSRKNAGQMLEDFVLGTLRYTHEQTSGKPRINELVESITAERPDLVRQKAESAEAMISEILARGNATGEFDVSDIRTTAKSIHAATVLFEVPIFIDLYPLAEYERTARSVVELLLAGLRRR